MLRISVIGTGYVGLVTGACFAEMGYRATCVEIDKKKVDALRAGVCPIYEPGLDEILTRQLRSGSLQVTTDTRQGIQDADFIFFCVGTPSTPDGQVDLSYLNTAYMNVKSALGTARPIMVNKSTVPPGTADMMAHLISDLNSGHPPPPVVSNPEFLREGCAVQDFMHPSRIVVGSSDPSAALKVAALYESLAAPVIATDSRTAEMIKYASNAFLATKISFINEIAAVCEHAGMDVTDVSRGIGLDPRILSSFLNAGIGYGGSCLPKDVAMLHHLARSVHVTPKLLSSVMSVNSEQPLRLLDRLAREMGDLHGHEIAVLGLGFKPDTDDIRNSPALGIIEELLERGAKVRVSDPVAWSKARDLLQDSVTFEPDPYAAAAGAEAVVLATEWEDYRRLDLARLRSMMDGDLFVDGRRAIAPTAAAEAGFRYLGVGREMQGSSAKVALSTNGVFSHTTFVQSVA